MIHSQFALVPGSQGDAPRCEKPGFWYRCVVVGCCGMLSACVESRIDLPVIEASERFVLRGPEEPPICGGSFAHMEDMVVYIQDELLPNEPPRTVTHTWVPFGFDEEYEDICGPGFLACVDDGTKSYDRRLASAHELVHASRPGFPSRILEEGVATMFGEIVSSAMAPRDELYGELTEPSGDLSGRLYERSGHFVSFLVALVGAQEFFEFDSRLRTQRGSGKRAPGWDPLFVEFFGLTFEELWADYADYPDCSPRQFHWSVTRCPEIDTVNDGVVILEPDFGTEIREENSVVADFSCSSSEVVGPDGRGDWFRVREFVIQVPTLVLPQLYLVGDVKPGSRAVLSPCGNCWGGEAFVLNEERRKVLDLGIYDDERFVLTLVQPHAEDGDEPGELGVLVSY